MQKYPASVAQFSKSGTPYEAGETLKQPDLARTLDRIATQGPAGFYQGETALLLEKEMLANGGLITRDDLKNYAAKKRTPVKGTYRQLRTISCRSSSDISRLSIIMSVRMDTGTRDRPSRSISPRCVSPNARRPAISS